MKTLREGSLKLSINKKKIFFKWGRLFYSNVQLDELKIFLKVFKVKCHMCEGDIEPHRLGYIRLGHDVELALCTECLKDYAEFLERSVKKAVATER